MSSGLHPFFLPPHLSAKLSSGADPSGEGILIPALSQPDDLECYFDIVQYYQSDILNGSKPLQLMHAIAVQNMINAQSDEDASIFAGKVWNTLDPATKYKLGTYARTSPPNKGAIAGALYSPIRHVLPYRPYSVPAALVDSFTTMKVTEITEWVVVNLP